MSGHGARSIAINSAYLSSAKAIVSAARAIYAILLAKYLGAAAYGLYNYGFSWYLVLIPFTGLGLGAVVLHEVGRRRDGAGDIAGQTLVLRVLAGALIASIAALSAVALEGKGELRTLLLVFSLAILGRGVALAFNSVFQAYEVSRNTFLLDVTFRLMEVGIGVGLLISGYGVIELAILHSISWVLQAVAGGLLARKNIPEIHFPWNPTAFGRLLVKGAPFLVGAVSLAWLMQGPLLLFKYMHGTGPDLGYLALALQALFIIGAVLAEVALAALPVLARSVARNDGKSVLFVDIALRSGLLISGVLAISGYTVGGYLVQGLLGGEYHSVVSLLPWTLVLVGPYFLAHTFTSVLAAHGRYHTVMAINLLGAAAFTLAFLALGGEGHPASAVISIAIGFITLLCCQLRILAVDCPGKPLFGIAAAGAVTIAIGLSVTIALSSLSWVGGILGLAALLLSAALTRTIRASDINGLRSLLVRKTSADA